MSGLILAGGICIQKAGSESFVKWRLTWGRNVTNTSIMLFKDVTGSLKIVCLLVCFGHNSPLSGPWPPHSPGFQITHNDALESVGLLWTSDQPVAEISTRQHTTLMHVNAHSVN